MKRLELARKLEEAAFDLEVLKAKLLSAAMDIESGAPGEVAHEAGISIAHTFRGLPIKDIYKLAEDIDHDVEEKRLHS